MIKVIPNNASKLKQKPYFILEFNIEIGDFDAFKTNELRMPENISIAEGEKIYKKVSKILEDLKNRTGCTPKITLNDFGRVLCSPKKKAAEWFDISEEDVEYLSTLYRAYPYLFDSVEHDWTSLYGVSIKYYDEYGERHYCGVVDDENN